MWQNYRYFPYEQEFAKLEVKALFDQEPRSVLGGLEIEDHKNSEELVKRLTYFREASFSDGKVIVPDQCLLEASASGNGREITSEGYISGNVVLTRQSTRYSAHGLHEYKGKFNPQVVRAISNIIRLDKGKWVLDPFCGSGTTLLEGAHMGWNAVGIDLNPLGVMISNAKLQAIRANEENLRRYVEQLNARLRRRIVGMTYEKAWSDMEVQRIVGTGWEQRLPNFDYLRSWFPLSVLAQFLVILEEIEQVVEPPDRIIFKVILSDLTRSVSYQDPKDLRIRRRKDVKENYPVVELFLKSVQDKIETVLRARRVLSSFAGYQMAYVADSRRPLRWLVPMLQEYGFNGFDAVITSPPYVTALPYIDTQRLSLCLLGLVKANGIRELERMLTGSREITETTRRELEAALCTASSESLPNSVIDLCKLMLLYANKKNNGFRRRNMPVLTYRYFQEMVEVFRSVAEVSKSGAVFALVVGRNKTILSGEMIVIDTPMLLADIAGMYGWRLKEVVEMNTYHRYDVHKRNSIQSECLVLLERT